MINQALKIMRLSTKEFDHIRGDSETVAGLVLEVAGEIPKTNQVFNVNGFTFTVLEVAMNRIQKIKITIEGHQL
jgi:CBS domain containing-hemolysin-like protein